MDQEILHCLESTLSPIANIRISAELRLNELELQSESALSLANIVVNESIALHLRQITGSSLKKYIKEHWSPFFPTFKAPPATDVNVKAQIRELVFGGLSNPIRKIRLACAAIISLIAHPDWPDDWPHLTNQLLDLIAVGKNEFEVEGGMRVLNEFVSIDLSEDQLVPIARNMLPRLEVILIGNEGHSAATRARALLIFRQCVMTLFTIKDEHPQAVKTTINEILPNWIQIILQLLSRDVLAEVGGDDWSELSIRCALYSTLEIILNSFPSLLKPQLPLLLSATLASLSTVLPIYKANYLSTTSSTSPPNSTEEDSDVPSDLPSLVNGMLDFLTQCCRRKGLKEMFLADGGRKLLEGCVVGIGYGGMTVDDEENWSSDPNAFVADEDDEMVAYNVRAGSIDLIAGLIETYDQIAIESLWNSFLSSAKNADELRSQGDPDWWKVYESSLCIIGSISVDILDHIELKTESGESNKFDLSLLFNSIIPNFLIGSEQPFLQGRSFVFASQFSKVLPTELANLYIDSAIQVLALEEATVPVKVSAVRALNNFFRHLSEVIEPSRGVTTIAKLIPLLSQISDNTLVLVIETIESTLKVGGNSLDEESCKILVSSLLEIWFERSQDPMLASAICDLFLSFSSLPSPIITANLLQTTLPYLSTALISALSINDSFSTLASAVIDIIDNIFDGRPVEGFTGMFSVVAEGLFGLMERTEERYAVQSGLHIFTTVVRKDVDQLLNWSNEKGSALPQLLSVIAKLLDPSQSESGGLFIGDLTIHLIRQVGNVMGDVLPDLLKAFVVRLDSSETASFSQSLILPFAYLIHSQSAVVLSLLELIEFPPNANSTTSRSGLQVLLTKWSETVEVFQGYWNLKVSSVGLTTLFLENRESLNNVFVKGDLLLTAANSNVIMTRARAKQNPDQFSSIPFPAKILKILLHDLQTSDSAKIGDGIEEGDVESDDGDDEWADDGAEFLSDDKDLDFLSDMLKPGGGLDGFLNDDDSEVGFEDRVDELDLKDDPIFLLDLPSHLTNFFKSSYSNNTNGFIQLVEQYLSQAEKDFLAFVLQS